MGVVYFIDNSVYDALLQFVPPSHTTHVVYRFGLPVVGFDYGSSLFYWILYEHARFVKVTRDFHAIMVVDCGQLRDRGMRRAIASLVGSMKDVIAVFSTRHERHVVEQWCNSSCDTVGLVSRDAHAFVRISPPSGGGFEAKTRRKKKAARTDRSAHAYTDARAGKTMTRLHNDNSWSSKDAPSTDPS